MKVKCEVEETELESDEGYEIPSVRVACSRCGHESESFGTSGASIRRCLLELRQECPRGESNFYTAEGDDD